jgi:Fibronectin type III domain
MRKSRFASAGVALAMAAGLLVVQPPAIAHAANVPGTSCSVFPANNIWNTDISAMPVNTHSAAWLTSTGASAGRLLHPDFGGAPYGIPFNVVDNTHPTTTFAFQYASESDAGPYPYGSDLVREAPTDSHLLTVNKDTCKLYETWATDYNGPSTAGSGAIFDLASNALRPAGWTSADAAGLPIFPGLVRLDEVAAGLIAHAIRFTVQQSDKSYLWPARHQAGSANNPNLPPMGARFRLKSTFDISGFGAAAQVVLTTMKQYGLIVADNGSNWFFQGTMDAGWNAGPYPAMISELKTVPASQFEAIDESSLMADPNSAVASVPGAPANVVGTAQNSGAGVTWTAPANTGSSAITSYEVTAYDGCTIQGKVIVTGSPPGTSATFFQLDNGTAYTFKVAAVNSFGVGPQSVASNVVVPAGITKPTRLTACSTRQYHLIGNNGTAWADIDSTNLTLTFSGVFTNASAIITGNADLFTAQAGYNQDIGIDVNGSVIAWKESGGFAGTFSPNAATVQAVIPVVDTGTYTVKLRWKANRADPGTIYAGAGPIAGAYSPTRLTVQLLQTQTVPFVVSSMITTQRSLTGGDGSWQDMDVTNLNVSFTPPAGATLALVSANSDLFTSTAGFNQDIGVALTGGAYPTVPNQPEAWKESGGFAGTYSPNAAFVHAGLAVVPGTAYTARVQWRANKLGASKIWAGAGPIGGLYSPTTLTVIFVYQSLAATSTAQYSQTNSDGATWNAIDATNLKLTFTPAMGGAYGISTNADLFTSVAGYNQDIGIMASGGAYGTGTLVAWKESGGFAGTFSPNAAFVDTVLQLMGGTAYTFTVVWKANRAHQVNNAIWAGAGPVNTHYSTTSLTAHRFG